MTDRPRTAPAALADDPDAGTADLLRRAAELAIDYRSSLADAAGRPATDVSVDDLRRTLGGPLPREATDPRASSTSSSTVSNPGSSR